MSPSIGNRTRLECMIRSFVVVAQRVMMNFDDDGGDVAVADEDYGDQHVVVAVAVAVVGDVTVVVVVDDDQ